MVNENLIFDARHLSNEFSGLGRYTYHLLLAVIGISCKFENIVILIDKDINEDNTLYKDLLTKSSRCNNIKFVRLKIKVFRLSNYFFLSRILNKYEGYTFFQPHFDLPFFLKLQKTFVIHDLFPLVVPGYIVKKAFIKKAVFYCLAFLSLNTKSLCIAISNSTKEDINKWFKFKRTDIKVVHSAACLNYKTSVSEQKSKRKFIFYIGDRRPHKNLKLMIDIFDILRLKQGYEGEFIIAGSTKNYDFDLDEYIKDKPYVSSVGIVTDEQLDEYYNNMESLFFMSKYEGFGLPVLEAATLNKKIITSNISSLPEVTPNSGILLDFRADIDTLAEKIYEYLDSKKEIRNESFVSAFSWHQTAMKIFIDKQV